MANAELEENRDRKGCSSVFLVSHAHIQGHTMTLQERRCCAVDCSLLSCPYKLTYHGK